MYSVGYNSGVNKYSHGKNSQPGSVNNENDTNILFRQTDNTAAFIIPLDNYYYYYHYHYYYQAAKLTSSIK